MKNNLLTIMIFLAGLSLASFAQAQSSLEGAWQVQEVVVEGGQNPGTNSDPQPSLYLFTERYYNVMYVPGTEPRAAAPGDDGFSDEERIAAFNSFIANSGSYERSGSTLTMSPIVARVPDVMSITIEAEYQLDGETLVLTGTNANTGAVTRTTLSRLE
ncbi:MAG TPA: hypothetical protein VIV14_08035 [Gammaproteobacteria bacterium]